MHMCTDTHSFRMELHVSCNTPPHCADSQHHAACTCIFTSGNYSCWAASVYSIFPLFYIIARALRAAHRVKWCGLQCSLLYNITLHTAHRTALSLSHTDTYYTERSRSVCAEAHGSLIALSADSIVSFTVRRKVNTQAGEYATGLAVCEHDRSAVLQMVWWKSAPARWGHFLAPTYLKKSGHFKRLQDKKVEI